MRRILATAFLAVGLLAGCQSADQPPVTVEEARVQLPAMEGRPGAGYFVVETSAPMTLTGIASPRVERIELHQTRDENGVSRMVKLDSVAIEGTLAFEPGGHHAMLFGVDPALRAGERLPLTFTFDQAAPVTVEAEVQAFGGGHQDH